MNVMRTIPVSAVLLSVCLAPSLAQEPVSTEYALVYQLKHADAKGVAVAVNGIQHAVRVGWVEDSRLVLQGPEADVKRVVSTLIQPLDTPATSLSDTTPVAVIRLPKVPNDHFMSLVYALAQRSQTRLGFDPQNRVLVVRGRDADIDSIRRLVAELSKPMRALTVTCYFLHGRIGTAATSDGGKLPEQLKPVAATLQRTGMGEASLLAPMILNANDGVRFKSSSALLTSSPEAVDHILQFEVEGTATVTEDGQVELMMEGRVEVPQQSGEKAQHTWFDVNTTIATELGSYAVIAAAPGTTPDGDYVALVARVDRTD